MGIRNYYYRLDAWIRQRLFFSHYAKALERFRDVHASEKRCFIIGNGPSIKEQDLRLLNGEFTFATNYFVLHENFPEIGLRYLCMSNPRFWREGRLPANLLEVLEQYPELPLFFDFSFVSVNARRKYFSEDRCFYVKVDLESRVEDGKLSLDPTKGLCHGSTVIIDLCIPLAFFMGFREIYLLGCDCDYGLDKATDHSKAYFYNIAKQDTKPDPVDYMTQEWPRRVFGSYEEVKRVLGQHGGRIYNATRGGKLEVF